MCSACGALSDATRRIVLTRVPPSLSCQLLRFSYDVEAGVRKKISARMVIPKTLHLAQYTEGAQASRPRSKMTHRRSTRWSET